MAKYPEFSITSLVEKLGSDIGSCPDFLAERLLKESYIEFCRDSECYRHSHSFQTLQDDPLYEYLNLPENVYVLRCDWVKYNDKELKPITTQEAVLAPSVVEPDAYYTDPECITLSPPPSNDGDKVRCELILVPTHTIESIPVDIYGRYWLCIRSLLLYRLFAQPDCHWTDLQRAQWHYTEYQRYLPRAIREGKKHHQNIQRKVRYGGI